ncbi:MAG: hypothetical protein CMH12_00440 [Maritimibacter sp.]|nr:hypothetical protein [Maritimibacter sp.]
MTRTPYATTRRRFLAGSSALIAGSSLNTKAFAQSRPDKIVVAGLQIKWKRTFEEEIGPAFEEATGIKVVHEWLPIDALAARLKTQMGSGGIDVGWFNTGNVAAMAEYCADCLTSAPVGQF